MNKYSNWLQRRLNELDDLIKYINPDTISNVIAKSGISNKDVIKLNQNENLFLSKEFLSTILNEISKEIDLRIYPKEEVANAKEMIAKFNGISTENIMLGNGSDQILDLLIRTFLKKDDVAVSIIPTYSMYKWSVNHSGVRYIEVPLNDDFSLDVDGILESINGKEGMCFICSPNNPTSNQFNLYDILTIIENFPGIVVIDEAYVEYAKDSLIKLVKDYENLIITRTFSKAFGLAGVRIGYAAANPDITNIINENAQMPYALNCFALKFPSKIFNYFNEFKKNIDSLKKERERQITRLNKISGVKAFKSDTNFILFNLIKSHLESYNELLLKGVLVRKIGKIGKYNNCLRVTVGLPYMNDIFVEMLKSISE